MAYAIDGLVTGGAEVRGPRAHDAWQDWCSDVHGEFGVSFFDESYQGEVVRQRSATYSLVTWTSESELVRRDARGIRHDPRDHYELFVPLRDTLHLGTDAADHPLQPGEMVLVPINAPFSVAHDDWAVATTLLVPCHRVDQRLGTLPREGFRLVGSGGLPRVTRDLLTSLIRERDTLTGAEFDAVADRIVDLFCLAADGDERLPDTSGSEVIDAVRRHIRAHATDPDLTVTRMAAAIGWSPRYIQEVLARDGLTARDLIRQERLELARARLAQPQFAGDTIAQIAASVGYGSASAFTTAFRRHFGASPRELRSDVGVS